MPLDAKLLASAGCDSGAVARPWQPSAKTPSMSALRFNDSIYERLAAWLYECVLGMHYPATATFAGSAPDFSQYRSAKVEIILECLQDMAHFAAYHHCGRFADGRIENIAFNLGVQLTGDDDEVANQWLDHLGEVNTRPGDRRRRVLHVVTSLEPIGGVTQAVRRWVELDGSSRHSLLVISQRGKQVPLSVLRAIEANGGTIVRLPPAASFRAKARAVRQAAKALGDFVFVHTYPHDLVPTLAFAAPGGPPVAILNHSDHMFWVGSSVADLLIDWRSNGQRVSESRRYPQRTRMLPLPLSEDENGLGSDRQGRRQHARELLGIPESQPMLLSVGRAVKYRPAAGQNFFCTANQILAQNRSAHLYVIGVGAADATPFVDTAAMQDRCHFLGPLLDPSLYQAAADVYLEGFPFGSSTALLEAALAAVPTVGAYAPISELLVANDDAIAELQIRPRTEEEYVATATTLLADPRRRDRVGRELAERLRCTHMGKAWLARLEAIYAEMEFIDHTPRCIQPSVCSITDLDVALAEWCQETAKDEAHHSSRGEAIAAVVCSVAYDLRGHGAYWAASWLLWHSLHSGAAKRPLFKALAKLPVHWLLQKVGLRAPSSEDHG